MKSPGVTISMVVEVDPADAFAVFTNEIGRWWKPHYQNRFRADRSGRMHFESGVGGRLLETYEDAPDAPFEVGRILVWEPGRRLVFDWKLESFFAPEQVTEVEVCFEAIADGTRITLEHRGWDAVPKNHPARHGLGDEQFWIMKGAWWRDLLRAAKTYAEKKEKL